jgi:hypothetical protein
MKRNILNILLLAGAAVIFSSCKDDDEKSASSFKIDAVSTTIKTGVFIQSSDLSGENNDIYRHELAFLGEGLSIVEGQAVGEGNALHMEIVSSTTALEPGTYSFKGSDVGSKAFDFSYGTAYIDLNADDEQEFEFTEGTITVSKSGEVYTINVSGTADGVDGVAVEAQFSGKLVSLAKD